MRAGNTLMRFEAPRCCRLNGPASSAGAGYGAARLSRIQLLRRCAGSVPRLPGGLQQEWRQLDLSLEMSERNPTLSDRVRMFYSPYEPGLLWFSVRAAVYRAHVPVLSQQVLGKNPVPSTAECDPAVHLSSRTLAASPSSVGRPPMRSTRTDLQSVGWGLGGLVRGGRRQFAQGQPPAALQATCCWRCEAPLSPGVYRADQ